MKNLVLRTARPWLIAYDIRDPGRLGRVGRLVARCAFRLHYSLYIAELTERQRQSFADRLTRLIDPETDDLRFYPVPDSVFGSWLGPAPLAGGTDAFVFGSASESFVSRLRQNTGNI